MEEERYNIGPNVSSVELNRGLLLDRMEDQLDNSHDFYPYICNKTNTNTNNKSINNTINNLNNTNNTINNTNNNLNNTFVNNFTFTFKLKEAQEYLQK